MTSCMSLLNAVSLLSQSLIQMPSLSVLYILNKDFLTSSSLPNGRLCFNVCLRAIDSLPSESFTAAIYILSGTSTIDAITLASALAAFTLLFELISSQISL